jgi:hypothetical protein
MSLQRLAQAAYRRFGIARLSQREPTSSSRSMRPNDPSFGQLRDEQYRPDRQQRSGAADADIDAVEAGTITGSNSVVIGIIDTSADTHRPGRQHLDQPARPGNSIDDASAAVDDVTAGFINFDSGDRRQRPAPVSGTIGAWGITASWRESSGRFVDGNEIPQGPTVPGRSPPRRPPSTTST